MRRRTRMAGFSVTEAMIGVVLFGVFATLAIPRYFTAQDRSNDQAAVTHLHDVVAAIDAYRSKHDSLPASPDAAGIGPVDGVELSVWRVQTVKGVRSIHVHVRHVESEHTFHLHYPAEPGVSPLPWEW